MAEIIPFDPPPAPQNDSSGPPVAISELDATFELLISLIHPSKRVRTPNRKTKSIKQEPENKGPFDVAINIGWDEFLSLIAEKLTVVRSTLAITSFEWHWLKPASGPWLPIQDESGFLSMLKKVKVKNEPYIIVRMQAPTQRKAVENAWDDADVVPDELDLEEGRAPKKVRYRLIVGILFTHILSDKAR